MSAEPEASGTGSRERFPFTVVGVSHRTAPIEVRERFWFGRAEASRALISLRSEADVREAVLLSTCNRTEFYLLPGEDESWMETLEELLARKVGPLEEGVRAYLFQHHGLEAARHLFRVTSGLDSMVTGEAEIQGQVRDAYEMSTELALEPPMADTVLNRLFQMALAVGGTVRAETGLGEGAASVASVAVELAGKIFGALRGKNVLILGAGDTGELIVEALGREGAEGVIVANRTYERAVNLAERLRGHAVPFDRLPEAVGSADIVLSSTAAPHAVLSRNVLQEAFPHGLRQPLFVIDIAIPRDVDPALGDEPNVFLYNLDDLQQIVEEHVQIRKDAIPKAQRLIGAQLEEFHKWLASQEVVPVIRHLRGRGEEIRSDELERLFQRLPHLPEEDRTRVEEFSRRFMNKLLHDPTVRLREGVRHRDRDQIVEAVRYLYGMEDDGADDEGEGEREGEGKEERTEDEVTERVSQRKGDEGARQP